MRKLWLILIIVLVVLIVGTFSLLNLKEFQSPEFYTGVQPVPAGPDRSLAFHPEHIQTTANSTVDISVSSFIDESLENEVSFVNLELEECTGDISEKINFVDFFQEVTFGEVFHFNVTLETFDVFIENAICTVRLVNAENVSHVIASRQLSISFD